MWLNYIYISSIHGCLWLHVYLIMSNWKCTGSSFCLPDRLSVDDLAAVQRRLFAVRTEWYNLGLELGQHPSTLDSIDATNNGDPSKCFRQVMKKWLRGIDPPPTWQAVVDALKSPTVAQYKLAEQIQNELLPTQSMPPLPPRTLSPPPHPMSSGSSNYCLTFQLVIPLE